MTVKFKGYSVGQPTIGWVIACSRKGFSHRNASTLAQDAHAVWSSSTAGQDALAVAVADGHGDERHSLSHIGSAVAARVAVEALAQLWQEIVLNPDIAPDALYQARSKLPSILHRKWSQELTSLVNEFQFTQESNKRSINAENSFEKFGTTLICSLVVDECILIAQIGDGVAVWIGEDGHIDFPLQEPSDEITNATNSMCSPKAIIEFNVAVLRIQQSGILIHATDGFANSFASTTDFRESLQSLLDRSQQFKYDDLLDSTPRWLEHFTHNGSGDDISLVLTRIFKPHVHTDEIRNSLEEQSAEIEQTRAQSLASEVAEHKLRTQSLRQKQQELETELELLANAHEKKVDLLNRNFDQEKHRNDLLTNDLDSEIRRKSSVLEKIMIVFKRYRKE